MIFGLAFFWQRTQSSYVITYYYSIMRKTMIINFLFGFFPDMIPVAAFFNVDWITVRSMFFQNKRSIRIISRWRMNAVLEMTKLEFSSCPVWPVTKWIKCLVFYVMPSLRCTTDILWLMEPFFCHPDSKVVHVYK